MAIAAQWRINPGRNDEFMKSTSLARKHGASVRVYQQTAAGPNTGVVTFVMEVEDRHVWANVYDSLFADPEWVAMMAGTTGANAPATLLSQSLANEITPD